MNLLMCIPPDHQRNDLPSAVTARDVVARCKARDGNADMHFVYVGITDDMGNTVTLPCFDCQVTDGKVVLMAHRTGRPVA